MTHEFRRPGVKGHARPILLSLFVAASAIGIQVVPSSVHLPVDRPAALQPKVADASVPTCTTHPLFTGHLTASSSSTTAISRITNGTVYHYISNIDRDWNCDTLFRYSGTAWNTTATTGTFKWGNNINSTSGGCYWLVGTTDYTKANSTTDCPDYDAEYAFAMALSPQAIYHNDGAHDDIYDFSYVHSACDIYLGASVQLTGKVFTTSDPSNRPNSADCDAITLDGQTTSQTVTYDSTAPATSFTAPAGSPGTKVYVTSAGSYDVTRTITEAVAGFAGTSTWKLQRQIANLTTPNSCGGFANDPAAGNYNANTSTGPVTTNQTLVDQKCYQWMANATDQNGNVMAQVTSATVVVDASAPTTTFTAPITGTTTVLNGTSYSVSWTESEVGTGITTRSLQRKKIAWTTPGVCPSGPSNDGSAVTTASPVAATLVDGNCYQWVQTLTDVAGNQTVTTSGWVLVDVGSPSANFSTPDEGTTTVQSSTSYTVAWSETAGSGSITARSLQRQKGAIATPNTCADVTFSNDGSAITNTSSVLVTGLVSGYCYRWVQTLTNSVPKSGSSTSGMVLVDANGPSGDIATPEANRPIAGIVTISGNAKDDSTGHPESFRDYTLEYGSGTSPASWTSLGTFTTSVSGTGALGTWDTTALSGVYTVRLTVRDWAGNGFTPVTRTVYVENTKRGTESYYERTPFDLGGGWILDVGVANGEARLSRDLFTIPSYGPSQALSLTFSSLETTASGRFGYGWSSNLTQFLSFESGFVVWHRPDGGRVPFGNIGGTWTPLRGHFETLTSAGSEYTITLKDQTRYVFENSGSGRLKRIENRFGKALTMVWNSSSATATDASGRVMNITINQSKDRISDVTDSAGRTWTFGYATGNTNDLLTITDPAGKVTTLAYDGTHRLTSVSRTRTPASGSAVTVLWSIGYTSGKATSVTDSVNTTVSHSFTYNAGNTVVGLLKEYSPVVRNTWTYTFDSMGLGRATVITDPQSFETTKVYDDDSNVTQLLRPVAANPGEPTDYQTTSFEYDGRGNVLTEGLDLDTIGATLTSKSGYSASNDMLWTVRASGDSTLLVITKFSYDGAGHLVTITVNCTTSGTTPPVDPSTCTGAGAQDASTNLITNLTYTSNDQLQDETDPMGRVTRHAYDTNGNETSITRNYVSGQSATSDRNVVESRAYNSAVTAGKAGLATSTTDALGNVTTYTYDALGRQLTEVLPTDSSIPSLTSTAAYDEFGNVVTETASWTGVTRTTTHVYDKANRETSVTDPVGVVASVSYDAAGNKTSVTERGVTTTNTFDGLGRVLTETEAGATTSHTYDPAGLERETQDAVLTQTSYEYDRGGRLRKVTIQGSSADEVTTYTYDAFGRQTSSVDPTGMMSAYTLDGPGNSLTVDVDGRVTSNIYDRAGNLVTAYNPDGTVSAWTFDALNRSLSTITNCTNSGTTAPTFPAVCTGSGTHNATTNVTVATYYDAAGNVVATKDAIGSVFRNFPNVRNISKTSFSNCTNTGSTAPSDPATCTGAGTSDSKTNVKTSTTYDGEGAVVGRSDAVGLSGQEGTSETAYNGAGQVQASRDPLGTVTRYFFDSSGRPTSVVSNCTNTGTTVPGSGWDTCAGTGTHDATWNATTSYTYDSAGNRDTETQPNGRVTKFVFDGAGRVTERIDNFTAGSPAADQNLSTYFEYDEVGRIKVLRTPTADRSTFSLTGFVYDESGRIVAQLRNCTLSGTTPPIDPDWRGCRPTWDDVNQVWIVLGTQDADTNILTTYTYDVEGNRTSMTAPSPSDSAGGIATATTYYAYDDANRLCRVLEAASTDLATLAIPCSTSVSSTTTSNISTRYTYDTAGNLASLIDSAGHTTSYAYDAAGHMTGLTDALSNTLSWTYDALGRRAGQTNRSTGSVTWTHDAAGRILTRAATSVATVTYAYDLNGNLLSAGDGTATITTTYDRLNRPTQVTVSGDSGATTNYTYSFTSPTWSDASGSYTATIDKFGRETGLLDPIHGATPWTSAYRADAQQASLAAPNGNTTAWTYDDAGRPTGSATTAAGPVTRASYTYALNRAGQRLSEASSITGDPTNGTVNFSYDALGRLTGYSGTPVTTQAYTWDRVANRLTKQVGGGTTVTMTYNNANRPTSDTAGNTYTNDLDGRLTGQIGQTLVWDALGRLTQVKDPITSANISTYTYDALDRLLTVSNGAGLAKFRYVGATNQIAQARDGSNAVLYNVGTSWAGAARMDFGAGGTNQRYYGTNGHGDLTWTGSSTGTVSATLRSDPWGNPGSTSGGSLPPFRFQGSWYDTSSALAWAVARWYAPGMGRFVSEDVLLGRAEAPASRHLFAFGAGDPVDRIDQQGTYWTYVRRWIEPHPEWKFLADVLIGVTCLALDAAVITAPIGFYCLAGTVLLGAVQTWIVTETPVYIYRVYKHLEPGLGVKVTKTAAIEEIKRDRNTNVVVSSVYKNESWLPAQQWQFRFDPGRRSDWSNCAGSWSEGARRGWFGGLDPGVCVGVSVFGYPLSGATSFLIDGYHAWWKPLSQAQYGVDFKSPRWPNYNL